LDRFGAVSAQTAVEMASGVMVISGSQLSAAVTGIAGPGGGTAAKPVGTVCFAWAARQQAPRSATAHFNGSRQEIRQQSAKTLIEGLIALTLSLDL
jgi:nicotinamide-nucleotide amidase